MKPKLQINTYLLPLLVVALIAIQLNSPSKVWRLLLAGLGGLWLFSYFYARSLVKNLTLLREMRYGWVQVGDILEERFTLKNKSWLPAPWVEIEDRTTLPGYNVSLATGVDGLSTTQWKKKGTCNQRGLYQLGDTVIHSGDPFGIYKIVIHDPAHISLLVMPPVIPLPMLDISTGGYGGEGQSVRHAPENTLDASSIRKYVSGDSIRLIHWKTTARMNEPYMRLFDGAPASDLWILLDLQDEVQVGDEEHGTEEQGIILTASLVDRGLRTHHNVGLLLNGGTVKRIPPRADTGHGWEILRTLALASCGTTPLDKMLKHIHPSIRQGTTLVVVTPTTEIDWLNIIPRLKMRGITLTVFLLDPQTFGGLVTNTKLTAALNQKGVTHYNIPRAFLDRPEARPGQAGQWEWRVSATGRSVSVRSPENYAWRRLSR